MAEYKVVELRVTGITPAGVADQLQEVLNEHEADGWRRDSIQPIIYNSSTTGYLLIVFVRG